MSQGQQEFYELPTEIQWSGKINIPPKLNLFSLLEQINTFKNTLGLFIWLEIDLLTSSMAAIAEIKNNSTHSNCPCAA